MKTVLRPTAALLALAAVKLLLHLATNHNYGYFIDELYYLACSEHLDFGYVDHPPMIALVTRLIRTFLGDSLPALRFLPALAGAATVFLAGLIARELGGGRFAQGLAALAILVCPLYLYMNTILSMNALDGLIWTLAAWLVARILNRSDAAATGEAGDRRALSVSQLWLVLGLVLGVGLLNKISVLFFGFGLAVGLVLTRERRHLGTPWPWCGGAIAFALFLPHVVWQAAHAWPTLEFIRRASTIKNRPLSVVDFLSAQALEIHPLSFPLLLLGLWFFLISRPGERYRLFGWMYVALFLLLVTRNAKPYYAGPIYPLMLAGGSVAVARLLARLRWRWPRVAIPAALALGGAAVAPMTLPVLPVETLVDYLELFGGPPPSSEQKSIGALPQHYADMFGNEELVDAVAEVYGELDADERSRAAIFGMAYPQAAAVDFFGGRYGLPKAISGHNSYWLWGPGEHTGEIVIVLGLSEETLTPLFDEVTLARTVYHPYAMPWRNHLPIWVCRGLRGSIKELWPEWKEYQ